MVANILRFFDFSRWRIKFCQNRLFLCGDIAIFHFSRWPTPPSWIFQIAKFYWLLGSKGSRRISMPDFVKIGQSVATILRFSHFSRWRPPQSWIFEIMNFYFLSVSGGPRRITVPNFVKIGQSVAKILRFFHFSWPPSWIFEFVNFYLLSVSEDAGASLYHILSKSVVPLWRYCDFSIFQNGGRRHLGFSNL